MKSVRIWRFSGPYFPAFGLNMEIYSVNLRIQSKFRKVRTRKTPNMDTFYSISSIKYKKTTIIRMNAINYMRYTICDYHCYHGKADRSSHRRCSIKRCSQMFCKRLLDFHEKYRYIS